MKRLPLSLLAHWAGGELRGDDVVVDSINNDTRSLMPGGLYVAIRGERFDGHDFAYDAAMRGAGALLVGHPVEVELPQIVVEDTELALGRIATQLQRERTSKVIAITGSNGKTSVKTLLQSILSRAGQSYVNPGNRNNEIGLPLSVIDAPDDADFAVYEMGAGKPGDIAYLAEIAVPDVSLVNNIGAAHLERMGSLMGIAETKGAILSALRKDGTAVINADDAFAEYFATRAPGRRLLRFGIDSSADVTARDIKVGDTGSTFVLVSPQGEIEVALPLPGRHNVLNALAAASLALASGASLATIAEGLSTAAPVPGRQIAHGLANGVVLIDDSYNANPASLGAAIDTLAAYGSESWLVLGDMRELGADADALHAEAGRQATAAGIQRLYTLGPLSAAAAGAFGDNARVFQTHAELAEALQQDLRKRAGELQEHRVLRVLVKGSRGSAMERVVHTLLSTAATSPGEGETNAA